MKTSFTQCPLFPLGDSGFMCVCNKPVQTEWQLCIGGVAVGSFQITVKGVSTFTAPLRITLELVTREFLSCKIHRTSQRSALRPSLQ